LKRIAKQCRLKKLLQIAPFEINFDLRCLLGPCSAHPESAIFGIIFAARIEGENDGDCADADTIEATKNAP
jgi:hypothetical protein